MYNLREQEGRSIFFYKKHLKYYIFIGSQYASEGYKIKDLTTEVKTRMNLMCSKQHPCYTVTERNASSRNRVYPLKLYFEVKHRTKIQLVNFNIQIMSLKCMKKNYYEFASSFFLLLKINSVITMYISLRMLRYKQTSRGVAR